MYQGVFDHESITYDIIKLTLGDYLRRYFIV